MSILHTQGIQAKGKHIFPGEWHKGLCPESKEFCVCAWEVSRWPWGGHREDRKHPICGKIFSHTNLNEGVVFPAVLWRQAHIDHTDCSNVIHCEKNFFFRVWLSPSLLFLSYLHRQWWMSSDPTPSSCEPSSLCTLIALVLISSWTALSMRFCGASRTLFSQKYTAWDLKSMNILGWCGRYVVCLIAAIEKWDW